MTLEDLMRLITENHNAVVARHDATTTKVGAITDRFNELEQKLARRGTDPDYISAGRPEWGAKMTASPEFAALVASGRGRARVGVTMQVTTATVGGVIPQHTITDPIVLPRRRATLRDLLNVGPTSSNSIKYVQMTSRTNNARVVSEGQTKPTSEYAFTPKTADVVTIAHLVPASKQILSDAPAVQTMIDTELRYGVQEAEVAEVLAGDGTGEHLLGLIPQATVYANPLTLPPDPQALDVLLGAIAQLAAAELQPTGVVLHPLDWAEMRQLKDGEGRYLVGSPLADLAASVWGLPAVLSTALEQGDFLMGDFRRAATLFVREDAVVEISTEHSDFFARNLVALRGEERVALAVTQPLALIYGSLLPTT